MLSILAVNTIDSAPPMFLDLLLDLKELNNELRYISRAVRYLNN